MLFLFHASLVSADAEPASEQCLLSATSGVPFNGSTRRALLRNVCRAVAVRRRSFGIWSRGAP